MTPEVVETLLLPPAEHEDPNNLLAHFVLLLLVAGGMPASTVIRLKLTDIDLDAGTLRYARGRRSGECLIEGVVQQAARRYLVEARPRLVRPSMPSPYLFVAPRQQMAAMCHTRRSVTLWRCMRASVECRISC